jgi:hypothetical protein
MAELRPRLEAYVALVGQVVQEPDELGVLGLRVVDRKGGHVNGEVLPVRLEDSYAVIVGHPMEALGGHPAPERYTAAGVNRPRVFFGFVATPDPDQPLTEEVISQLADRARAIVEKRLKDQAAMEQAAQDH